MAKDDFDIDFDFEKEYGLDPDLFADAEEYDNTDVDLSQFSDEELGLSDLPSGDTPAEGRSQGEDFDLDMDLDEFLNMGLEDNTGAEEDFGVQADEFPDPSEYEAEDPSHYDEDLTPELSEEELDEDPDLSDEGSEEIDMNERYDEQEDFEQESDPAEETKSKKKERAKKEKKPRKPIKIATPTIFTKFYDLYFAPVLNKGVPEEPQDPSKPRRRRRKTKMQIFKEVYLPPIVVSVCLILVLSFAIGSLSNFIEQKRIDRDVEQSRKESSISAQEQEEERRLALMEEAELYAQQYNYEEAIKCLESFGSLDAYPEMSAKRAEYANAQNQLVEIQDFTQIPNFSFHPLIVDSARAFDGDENSGQYNRNFVLTSEFSKILTTLYNSGYVLVDFDSFTTNTDGTIYSSSIYLPADKKPFMLTETLVNYFQYMVDGNDDGTPDASGDGFANKLVLDSNGDIKAEYVDSSGNTLIGDYDLVPILESFIEEHPDFSYKGARATLAVTGYEGIFGYRCNSTYISTKGQTYYDEQVAGAKQIVQALRDKGYTIACNTYGNENYANLNGNQINTDLQSWNQQIISLIGQVDVFVFARASNITDYNGSSFTIMHENGFRYFVSNGTTPSTQINSTYVRQNRLMVTGNSMVWNSDMFKNYFDCNTIVDLTARGGSVPN